MMLGEKKDVVMAREMLTSVASKREFSLARKSVAESMQRMYPDYVYYGQYESTTGRLTSINFVYKYSRLMAVKNRLKALFHRNPKALNQY